MAQSFFITTAIDYPSGRPHLGHLYEKVCTDSIARWHRLLGETVHFSTGLDEHGEKIQRKAEESEKSPEDFVNEMSKHFLELCKTYDISYDDFVRTTEKRHEAAVDDIFHKLWRNGKGDIYKGTYEGYYCFECETYYLERDLTNKKCPVHGKLLLKAKENTYLFKMSKYQDKLLKHINKNPDFILPRERRTEILSRLKEPLHDISISRTLFNWGLPLPIEEAREQEKHVYYVWLDALTNYLTTIGYPDSKYKKFWPALHIVGKDIIWHHCVIWPCLLLSAGIELPKTIFAHGFIRTESGEKMSKSAGEVVDPAQLAEKYPIDATRYFLLREFPFGEDGNFSEEALKTRMNSELANDLGNLLNRTMVMLGKYSSGKIPEGETGRKLQKALDLARIQRHMKSLELNNALAEIFRFVAAANAYINETEPWTLVGKGKELGNILYSLADSLRIISILLSPFMPSTSEKINSQLGVKAGMLSDAKFNLLKAGTKIGKAEILFRKAE